MSIGLTPKSNRVKVVAPWRFRRPVVDPLAGLTLLWTEDFDTYASGELQTVSGGNWNRYVGAGVSNVDGTNDWFECINGSRYQSTGLPTANGNAPMAVRSLADIPPAPNDSATFSWEIGFKRSSFINWVDIEAPGSDGVDTWRGRHVRQLLSSSITNGPFGSKRPYGTLVDIVLHIDADGIMRTYLGPPPFKLLDIPEFAANSGWSGGPNNVTMGGFGSDVIRHRQIRFYHTA